MRFLIELCVFVLMLCGIRLKTFLYAHRFCLLFSGSNMLAVAPRWSQSFWLFSVLPSTVWGVLYQVSCVRTLQERAATILYCEL